jgi:hypothetical protein
VNEVAAPIATANNARLREFRDRLQVLVAEYSDEDKPTRATYLMIVVLAIADAFKMERQGQVVNGATEEEFLHIARHAYRTIRASLKRAGS